MSTWILKCLRESSRTPIYTTSKPVDSAIFYCQKNISQTGYYIDSNNQLRMSTFSILVMDVQMGTGFWILIRNQLEKYLVLRNWYHCGRKVELQTEFICICLWTAVIRRGGAANSAKWQITKTSVYLLHVKKTKHLTTRLEEAY